MLIAFKPQEKNLLKDISSFAKDKKVKLYLVGGILRDIFLNRNKENLDIDFCLNKGAINFGKSLARQIKAGFVVLDKEHGACRLVKRIKDRSYTLDFTDFRGATLKEDLLHRDFSINTMALELDKVFNHGDLNAMLIDPYRARGDLKLKIIRVTNKRVFDEDPLRLLRAFSFSCLLGFEIGKETLRLIKLKKDQLSRVSTERIRDELFKILDRPDAFAYLLKMERMGILEIIFPEIKLMRRVNQGPYHHLDVWEHTLETLRLLEEVVGQHQKNKDIQEYLGEIVSPDRRRFALIKLGALLHDVGKPQARRRKGGKLTFYGHERIGLEIMEAVVQRLRLSNHEREALRKMVLWHLRPGYLADNEKITPRAIFRYFRDTAREAVSVLLIALADQRATRGKLTTKQSRMRHEKVVSNLIREYFRRASVTKPARLINGDVLIRKFGLEPSPLIGKILSQVEELQAIGKIKTKREALKVAEALIDK